MRLLTFVFFFLSFFFLLFAILGFMETKNAMKFLLNFLDDAEACIDYLELPPFINYTEVDISRADSVDQVEGIYAFDSSTCSAAAVRGGARFQLADASQDMCKAFQRQQILSMSLISSIEQIWNKQPHHDFLPIKDVGQIERVTRRARTVANFVLRKPFPRSRGVDSSYNTTVNATHAELVYRLTELASYAGEVSVVKRNHLTAMSGLSDLLWKVDTSMGHSLHESPSNVVVAQEFSASLKRALQSIDVSYRNTKLIGSLESELRQFGEMAKLVNVSPAKVQTDEIEHRLERLYELVVRVGVPSRVTLICSKMAGP